jgi:fatty-acid desaturase
MKNFKWVLVPFHLLAIAGLIYAVRIGQMLPLFFCFVLFWCLLGIGLEVGIHRLFSHHSYKASPGVEKILAVLGTLVGQGTVIFWVAIHRGYHHPYADTEKDPHSPVAHGAWQAYLGWLVNPSNELVTLRSAVNLLKQPFQVALHNHYFKVVWGFALALLVISPVLATGYFLAVVFCFHMTMLVNVLCHSRLGSRAYATKDSSRNLWWMAPLTWGLALHNTHHAQPGDPFFSRRWYEIDMSAWVIALIRLPIAR